MGVKDWADLKAKQKQKLSEVMFGAVCSYYREHGQMPADTELEKLAKIAFHKIQGRGLSYKTVHDVFMRKQARFAERIEKNGVPEPPKPKVKKTEAEKLAIKRAARTRKKQSWRHSNSRPCRSRMIVSFISPVIPPGVRPTALPGRKWDWNPGKN